MKAKAERMEHSQVVLEVEAEPEETEHALEEAYRHLVKRASVPGFRKGKAPRAMLERYIGTEALMDEALDHLVPQLLRQAIDEHDIEAIARPEVEITETDPVRFKAIIPVRPTVELGDYRALSIDPEPVEVSDEEIERVIEQLRNQHAVWEPVERVVAFGDLVIIDARGSLDGESVLDREDLQYNVVEGLPVPVPGFAEKIVGLERGQESEFAISFPDDHEVSELAGKEYTFSVRVKEIKEKRLPELDDELVKGIDEELDTVEALRARIADNLKAIAEERAQKSHREKVIEATVEGAQVEYPPVLVEGEIDALMSEYERGFKERRISLEEYLRASTKTMEEIREEFRPIAERRVEQSLVMDSVAQEEGIEVSDAEIEDEIERSVQDAGEDGPELKRLFSAPQARRALGEAILRQKTIMKLVEYASGDEQEHRQRREEDGTTA